MINSNNFFSIFRNDLGRRESTVILKSKYKTLSECDPDEIWFDYPDPDLPIMFNAKGTLVCDKRTKCFYDITIVTYKKKHKSHVPVVKVTVTIGGKIYIFYRVAVEAYTGELLTDCEIVDHIDRDRTNNSFENLAVVSSLESANNKRSTDKYRKDGTQAKEKVEQNSLVGQRKRLNKLCDKLGRERFKGSYTEEECALLPGLVHHGEDYLRRKASPQKSRMSLKSFSVSKQSLAFYMN